MAKKKKYTQEELLAEFDAPKSTDPLASVTISLDDAKKVGLTDDQINELGVSKTPTVNTQLMDLGKDVFKDLPAPTQKSNDPLASIQISADDIKKAEQPLNKVDAPPVNNPELMKMMDAPVAKPVVKAPIAAPKVKTPTAPAAPVEAVAAAPVLDPNAQPPVDPNAAPAVVAPTPDPSGNLMEQYVKGLNDGTIPQDQSPKAWLESQNPDANKNTLDNPQGLQIKGLEQESKAIDSGVKEGLFLAGINKSYNEAVARQAQNQIDNDKLANEVYNKSVQEEQSKIDSGRKALMDNPNNAHELFKASGMGGKIGLAIGAMLGGMFQGMNGMASNPFIDTIGKWIEGDRKKLQDDIAIARANNSDNLDLLKNKAIQADRQALFNATALKAEVDRKVNDYKSQNGYVPPEALAMQAKLQQTVDNLSNSNTQKIQERAAELSKMALQKQIEAQAKREEMFLKAGIDSKLQAEKSAQDKQNARINNLQKLQDEKAFNDAVADQNEAKQGLLYPDQYRGSKDPIDMRKIPVIKQTVESHTTARDLNSRISNVLTLRKNMKEIKRVFEKYGTDWNKISNEEETYANSLINMMRGMNRTDLVGPGAITEKEWVMLQSILPNIGNVFALNSNTMAKFKAFQDQSENSINNSFRSLGLKGKISDFDKDFENSLRTKEDSE